MRVTDTGRQTLILCGKSDIGMVREENQDSFCVQSAETPELEKSHGSLLVLADGMGGLARGGQASQIAVEEVCRVYYETSGDSETALVKAVERANAEIFEETQKMPGSQPMGSTLTAAAFVDGGAVVTQVGDSRAYHISPERGLEQLTRDHTLVQELADRGEIDPDSLHYLLNRNVLTRGLGLQERVDVDVVRVDDLTIGDTLLLCSDGLYEVVADSEIEKHVLSYGSAVEDLVNYLVELARTRGAPDNVTIVVARVESEEVAARQAATRRARRGGAARDGSDVSPLTVLRPVSYFVAFALGAILSLFFQGGPVGDLEDQSIESRIDALLEDPDVVDYLESHPQLHEELERLRRWEREQRGRRVEDIGPVR